MLRTRIAAAGASFAVFLAATLAGAAAQTAAGGVSDRPLPLLQIVGQGHKAKLRPHPKLAAKQARRTHAERRLATHVGRHVPARTRRAEARTPEQPGAPAGVAAASAAPAAASAASTPPADNVWLAPDAAIPGGAGTPGGAGMADGAGMPDGTGAPAGQLAPQQPTVSFTTEPVVTTTPDQIAGGSHTVQAGSPSGAAAPDVAAADSQPSAAPAAASPAGVGKQASAAPVSPAPGAHAMMVKPAAPSLTAPPSQVGSASWIAHVLAALGGAITAGVVAWFLIRPAAARRYG